MNLGPFTEPLRRNEYDIVITYDSPVYWRNVNQLDPELRSAIAGSYKPYCTFYYGLFHFPDDVDPAMSILAGRLKEIGCSPVSVEGSKNW